MSSPPKFRLRLRAQRPTSGCVSGQPAPVLSAQLQRYFDTQRAKASAAQQFQPSPQQQALFDWVEQGSGNLILQAVAGAGKTTSLIEAARRMQGTIFLGAFNKDAVKDIKAKATNAGVLRRGLYISTMHSAAFGSWRVKHPKVVVDAQKTSRLIDSVSRLGETNSDLRDAAVFVKKMVSFGKQFLMGVRAPVDNLVIWRKLALHFSADMELPEHIELERALEWVVEVYRRSHDQCRDVVDFDDMIYAPIAYNLRLFKNDWVLGDEWQDCNPARRELMRRSLKATGRAIFVGDARQAIYGFTGAGGDSLARTKAEFNCAELPLSVSYRCPKAVVSYVHQWVNHIEAHPTAADGEVRTPQYDAKQLDSVTHEPVPWFVQERLGSADAVLCRYTRPLVKTAYAMIKTGLPCKVAGRDIGKGLIALAQLWKVKTTAKLRERLATYYKREIAKARAEQSDRREQEVQDKVDTLVVFLDRCDQLGKHTIAELVQEIESLFADDTGGVLTLSTGHKAKGREWPRVYWLQTTQCKPPRKEWEAEQEDNLKYVIGTRAMQTLVLVPEELAS